MVLTILKNMSSSMGSIIPCIVENKKCLKPPTSWVILDYAAHTLGKHMQKPSIMGWMAWMSLYTDFSASWRTFSMVLKTVKHVQLGGTTNRRDSCWLGIRKWRGDHFRSGKTSRCSLTMPVAWRLKNGSRVNIVNQPSSTRTADIWG